MAHINPVNVIPIQSAGGDSEPDGTFHYQVALRGQPQASNPGVRYLSYHFKIQNNFAKIMKEIKI